MATKTKKYKSKLWVLFELFHSILILPKSDPFLKTFIELPHFSDTLSKKLKH